MSLFPETIDIKTTIQIKNNTFKISPLLRLSKRRDKTGTFHSDSVVFHPLAKTAIIETALNHPCSLEVSCQMNCEWSYYWASVLQRLREVDWGGVFADLWALNQMRIMDNMPIFLITPYERRSFSNTWRSISQHAGNISSRKGGWKWLSVIPALVER